MGCSSLTSRILLLLTFTVAVNSQSPMVTCYRDANCGGTSETITDEDYVGICCNWSSPGQRSTGYSYVEAPGGQCLPCPRMFGFFNTTFSAVESNSLVNLPVGYLSGQPLTSLGGVNIQLVPTTAGANDVSLSGAVNGRRQFPIQPNVLSITVSVEHIVDKISQERKEEYELTVSRLIGFEDFTLVDATGTIIDTDIVKFEFDEHDYSAGEGVDKAIVTTLLKDRGTLLANPVIFKVLPITIMEAMRNGLTIPEEARIVNNPNSPFEAIDADFNTTCFNVTFRPDEGGLLPSIEISVDIVDDDINERFEQYFLIGIEVAEAVDPSTVDISVDNITVGIIRDNDPLALGFNQSTFTFNETNDVLTGQVFLVKQNDRPTEQTFQIRISQTVGSATEGLDYSTALTNGSIIVTLRPEDDSLAFNITVLPDTLEELTERFILEALPHGGLRFSSPTDPALSQTTNIRIRDDDSPARVMCFVEDKCLGANQTLVTDDYLNVCCQYPSAGVRPLGYAYKFLDYDDCIACPKVFGFFNTTFSADESTATITIPMGYISGLPVNDLAVVNLNVTGITASDADFTVANTVMGFGEFTLNPGQLDVAVEIEHTNDGIAREIEEMYDLTLTNSRNLQDFTFVDSIGTILDTDMVTIGFIGAPYYVNETAGTATLTVGIINGATDVGVSLNVQLQNGSAIDPDDFSAGLSTSVITIDSSMPTADVMFAILDDAFYEQTETLYASLSFATDDDSLGVILDPVLAEVNIVDDDAIVIGFEESSYMVTEGDSVMVCIKVFNPPVNFPLSLSGDLLFNGSPILGSADLSDFSPSSLSFLVSSSAADMPATRVDCLQVFAVTDGVLENDVSEYFDISLSLSQSSPEPVTLQPNLTQIQIVDLDVVAIGFIGAPYFVNEKDGTVTLTVGVINGTLDVSVSLNVQLHDASAVASTDYLAGSSSNIIIDGSASRVNVTFTIVDDNVYELDETLSAMLTFAPGADNPRVALVPDLSEVNIEDDDTLTFGFKESLYEFNEEAGSESITVILMNGSLSDVSVTLAVQTEPSLTGEMATAGMDYVPTSADDLEFTDSMQSASFDVQILQDTTSELTESFIVRLTRVVSISITGFPENFTEMDADRILFVPELTRVDILDNDVTTIGFNPVNYIVSEDAGQITFMFGVLSGTLAFSVDIVFMTVNDTAYEGEDYVGVSSQYTFMSAESYSISVDVIDDALIEGQQRFMGHLESDGSLPSNVVLSPRIANAVIIDDDDIAIGFSPDVYTVSEGGIVNFNVTVISGTLIKDYFVEFFTLDGDATASVDYTSTNETLIFNMNTLSHIVPVMVASDSLLENAETFFGNLKLPQGSTLAVTLTPSAATATITDNNVAVIGFRGNYSVIEGDMVDLELLLLSGSLGRDVIVSVSTEDGTAQAPGDFSGVLSRQVTFSASQNNLFVSVATVDDSTAEDDEYFTARATLISPDVAVTIDPQVAFIEIEEDDPMIIGMDQVMVAVQENVGSVELCASVMSGIPERQAVVTVVYENDGAIGGVDYIGNNTRLTFSPEVTRQCFNVSIINDEYFESNEEFFVNLTTTDLLVSFSLQFTVVVINDEDVLVVGWEDSLYATNESAGRVQMCATAMVNGRPGGRIQTIVPRIFINLTAGSAQPGIQYSNNPAPPVFIFSSFTPLPLCTEVAIIPDEALGLYESNFFATLLAPEDARIILSPNQTEIVIAEDDGVVIGFGSTSVSIPENSTMFMMCVVVQGLTAIDITVFISTLQDTAVPGNDYITSQVPSSLVIPAGQMRVCFNSSAVVDDNIPEPTESFVLVINATDPMNDLISVDSVAATISITNDDVIVIGFARRSVNVPENSSFEICVFVQGHVTGDVNVSIASASGSALPGDDYLPSQLPSSLVIPAGQTQVCFNASPIVDDTTPEISKSFNLIITATDPTNEFIFIDPNTTTIFILDNDGFRVNDTVIGDPLFTVPLTVPEEQLDAVNLDRLSLCYEVHGESDQWFNLVTDNCISVNAHYSMLTSRLNIMDAIAVRAVDTASQCLNIKVDVAECSAMVGSHSLDVLSKYESEGVMVKRYSNRVRISVPNCQDVSLVMWVICENRTLESQGLKFNSAMIKFVVLRGLNFGHKQAHGLLGQYWNAPVSFAPYTGLLYNGMPAVGRYVVNVTTNGRTRSYTGFLHTATWDHSEGNCLYVGTRQSSPIAEVLTFNDPIIEDLYTNYIVKEPFSEDEDYKFGMFDESKCVNHPLE